MYLSKERLCYKKLSGEGPEYGWVSISMQGTVLAEVRQEDDYVDFSGIPTRTC